MARQWSKKSLVGFHKDISKALFGNYSQLKVKQNYNELKVRLIESFKSSCVWSYLKYRLHYQGLNSGVGCHVWFSLFHFLGSGTKKKFQEFFEDSQVCRKTQPYLLSLFSLFVKSTKPLIVKRYRKVVDKWCFINIFFN